MKKGLRTFGKSEGLFNVNPDLGEVKTQQDAEGLSAALGLKLTSVSLLT
jgi:hypothetical protein